jgi:hypoxanthine phosphoribosyltransferase
LQDVWADKARKRISPEEVSACCKRLVETIQGTYEPDIVIAIAAGGSAPGELIAQMLDISVVHLTIRRDINIPRRYSLDPIPMRWIMSIYHHFLFQTTKPTVSVNITADISGKKVLIVDDFLHTRATVEVAVEYLRKAGVSEAKVATLSYVSTKKPDFSALPRGNYSFPWSRDYAE